MKPIRGFTLAELLIALAILGVIATFTIPKILSAQQNGTKLAEAKEVASMIAQAYQQAQQAGTLSSSTKASDLSQYMNYVSVDTSSNYDWTPGLGALTCSAAQPCLKLHNGGVLVLFNSSFGGTATTNVLEFDFDPDAVYSGSTADGPGKSVQFELYYDGFLTSRGYAKANSCNSVYCPYGPDSNYEPSWFKWN